jgi:hypothetical protein
VKELNIKDWQRSSAEHHLLHTKRAAYAENLYITSLSAAHKSLFSV